MDLVDPDRTRDLCVGTVETWLAWRLSDGQLHVTDATNAALTGLTDRACEGWDAELLQALRIPATALPAMVDSSGIVGPASVLPGAPPIAGMAGDQQASLLGQGCITPGAAKITFGTGGMLDTVVGAERPTFHPRGGQGCFPIIAHRIAGRTTWGVEGAMLSAGTNVEWLRDDLGILPTAEASHEVAASVPDAAGAWYVPALLGLGTPRWDYGARGTLLGITRGTTAAHVVRAVLEGVAHRGADLVEAAEADGGQPIATIRVDGGMSANPTFVQALADATGRPIEVSPVPEATTLGAAFLAGIAVGTWSSVEDAAGTWTPSRVVEPRVATDRDRWRAAVERASAWIPELSSLDF
jgi:glycerol kinase